MEWASFLEEGTRAVLHRDDIAIDTVDLAFGVSVVGRDSLVFLPVRTDTSRVEGADLPPEERPTQHVLWTPSWRRELREWLPHFNSGFSSPRVADDSVLYYWGIARRDSTSRLYAIRYDFRTNRLDSLFLRNDHMATDYRYHLRTPLIGADEVQFGDAVIAKKTWRIIRREPPTN